MMNTMENAKRWAENLCLNYHARDVQALAKDYLAAKEEIRLLTDHFKMQKVAILHEAIEKMGWDEINAFNAELRKGQSVFEDAGGFMLRAIRRLFGLPEKDEEVITYQKAAQAAVSVAHCFKCDLPLQGEDTPFKKCTCK